jgi:hypothetical protein
LVTLALEDEDTTSLRNFWTPHPTAQCHIPEDLNPYQQHLCENPRKVTKDKNRSLTSAGNYEEI